MHKHLMQVGKATLAALAAITLAGCATHPSTPTAADFGPAWKTVSCKTFDVPDAIAAQADCGFVTVPEQREPVPSRTIQLAVVRVRSAAASPLADPLFVEQGGPGDSTIGVFVNIVLPLKSPGLTGILQNRDLVFVEERGTRYSKPFLSCPEINAHYIAVAKGQKEFTDPGWIKACNARFQSEGVNPSAFNTRENAADIYTVAETLGYRQFNFYGGSYGTLLGQYVIAQADKHTAQLRSAILDGVVRPDIDFNLASTHTISHSLRNIFHDCAQDLGCSRAYPNLESRFLGLVDQFNQKPTPITLTVPSSQEKIPFQLTGTGLIDALLSALYRTAPAQDLPKRIQEVSQGNLAWVTEQLSGGLEPSNAKEMYHTVMCARTKSEVTSPEQILPAPYAQLRAVGARESEVVRRACETLKVDLKPVFVYENPQIPVLVLNGNYDPVTPQPYGEAVASHFKTAYVYTFPAVGHIALILLPSVPAAPCSAQIAGDFLNSPMQAPNSSCISQIKPAFVLE